MGKGNCLPGRSKCLVTYSLNGWTTQPPILHNEFLVDIGTRLPCDANSRRTRTQQMLVRCSDSQKCHKSNSSPQKISLSVGAYAHSAVPWGNRHTNKRRMWVAAARHIKWWSVSAKDDLGHFETSTGKIWRPWRGEVCVLDTRVCSAKTAEPQVSRHVRRTRAGPRNHHYQMGVQIPRGKLHIWVAVMRPFSKLLGVFVSLWTLRLRRTLLI